MQEISNKNKLKKVYTWQWNAQENLNTYVIITDLLTFYHNNWVTFVRFIKV